MKKRIIIYGAGTFFSKVFVFLLVPLYTRVFSQGDFGYYDVLVTDVQMIVSIAFIEIWAGIIRFMFEGKNKYKPIKTLFIMMPFLVILYAVGLFFLNYIVEIKYPLFTILYGILYLLFSVSNSICRGLEHNTKYVISGIISTVLSCSLSVVFSTVFHLGIEYLLVAQCIGYFVAIIYVEMTTKAYKNALHTTYQHGSIKEMSLYCIPLMINSLSFFFLGTYNKNIIISKLGEDYSGINAYIGKFSAIVAVLLSVYELAWQEQAFISASDDNREQKYTHYINEYIKIIGLGIPIYSVICVIISPIFGGEQYYHSEIYIPFAILSAYISNFSGVVGIIIAVEKKTINILISTLIGAAINVVIATSTISDYGINASAISLCICFFVISITRFLFSKKYFKLKIKWNCLALSFFEIVALFLVLFFVNNNLIIMFVLGIIFVVLWAIINHKTIKTFKDNMLKRIKK